MSQEEDYIIPTSWVGLYRTINPPIPYHNLSAHSSLISYSKRNAVNSFHTTPNSIDPHISFTIEEESDQQIAFLDTLVSRKDNMITIGVYRKATQTDRYLDFSSHHDKRHKISTAETLLHRAIKLPSTSQEKNTEINHVPDYPSYVISNILRRKFSKPPTHAIPTPEELVCMFFKWAAPHENPN